MFKRIKKAIDKFLEDLAKENSKQFGYGRMDCCKINKSNELPGRK